MQNRYISILHKTEGINELLMDVGLINVDMQSESAEGGVRKKHTVLIALFRRIST